MQIGKIISLSMKYDRFKDPYHIKWAKSVKERDSFICQLCGESGGILHSHHMNSWDFFEKERFDIDNGVTLCEGCHNRFHSIYGHGRNTKYQFNEYRELYNKIRKIANKEEDEY